LLASACGEETDTPAAPPPAGELQTLTDTNPDPDVVEVELVASAGEVEILAGKRTAVWGYRDGSAPDSTVTVPGPILEAEEGQSIVVHFRNELPADTTIHWHGIRLDETMDGSELTQDPIPPGGSFVYAFRALDAGLFWFHPHLDAEVQIERGLQAPLRVRGSPEIDVAADRILVLDDVKLDASGALSQKTVPMDLMMGRRGNVLLVNGRPDRTLAIASGSRERWRLLNTANGTFFHVRVPGHTLRVIGWDGGALPAPYETPTVLLSPGERYDVLVELDEAPGTELALETIHYDRGHDLPDEGPKRLARILLTEPLAGPPAPLPARWGTVTPLPVARTLTPVRRIVLSEKMRDLDPGAEPEFFINQAKWPMVPPIEVSRGLLEIWEVQNDAEMDHPLHIHGLFFQVLDVDGAPETRLGNKDTAIVPREKTMRLALRYDALGHWMYHCHILEHATRGMMGHIHVRP
jgi:FtsP/CotA-like multicopper oxidase with cupredoxin domain